MTRHCLALARNNYCTNKLAFKEFPAVNLVLVQILKQVEEEVAQLNGAQDSLVCSVDAC
jgi:hypothetical protein